MALSSLIGNLPVPPTLTARSRATYWVIVVSFQKSGTEMGRLGGVPSRDMLPTAARLSAGAGTIDRRQPGAGATGKGGWRVDRMDFAGHVRPADAGVFSVHARGFLRKIGRASCRERA